MQKRKNKYKFDTLQIYAGSRHDPSTGSRQVPIYHIFDTELLCKTQTSRQEYIENKILSSSLYF